jgi:ferritin-like metal-binding protein YciE
MAHVFNLSPKLAQIGHSAYERTTQDLMMAYSVERAEVAMYEVMLVAAEAAGDTETAQLASQIQQQEAQTSEKIWQQNSAVSRPRISGATRRKRGRCQDCDVLSAGR